MQYIEYVELQIKELKLHNVILTMTYKSYIITGVYLQINEHADDTDWYNFNYIDNLWMKYTLYRVLTVNAFDNVSGEYIQYLKCNSDEIKELKFDQANS